MAKGSQSGSGAAQMKPAWKLYEAGDVVHARREAKKVLAGSPSPDEAAEANDLLERTRFPRTGLYLALLAIGLLLGMILLGHFRG